MNVPTENRPGMAASPRFRTGRWLVRGAALVALALGTLATATAQEVGKMSLEQLGKEVESAPAGRIIVLPEGVYEAGKAVRLAGKGTAEEPIVIRAAAIGKAVFRSPISLEGEYVTLAGIRFEGKANIEINGTGIRVTRCEMDDVRQGRWIRVQTGSRQVEIDHCRFANKTNNRELPRGCQLLQIVVRNQGERHHVHRNHFVDIPEGKSSNGYETLQLITQGNPFNPPPGDCGTVIEYNLFERCNGEAEVISVKSNGNVLRGNTFRNCRGGLVLRHGHGNRVVQCFFVGDEEPRAGGIRMQGRDQVVVNNSFLALRSYGIAMMDGTPDDLYVRTEQATVAFNTFVDCSPAMAVGLNHSKHPNGTPPKDCIIANNVFFYRNPEAGTGVQTVRLVQDDEPEDWTWEGNVTNGDLGMPPRAGIERVALSLDVLDSGVALPAAALVNAAAGDYPDIVVDAFGQTRGERKTIGCIESPRPPASGGPLIAEQVGPMAGLDEAPRP